MPDRLADEPGRGAAAAAKKTAGRAYETVAAVRSVGKTGRDAGRCPAGVGGACGAMAMKTGILLIGAMLAAGLRAGAQVRTVRTDSDGRCRITVQVGERRFVTLDESGRFDRVEWRGRRTYYDAYANRCKQGRLKELDGVQFDYYDSFDDPDKQGRIKRIGEVVFDYYDRFDDDRKRSKIKRIGAETVDFYDRFDDEAKCGKVRRIGSVEFDYYDRFAPDFKRGRLARIGSERFDYDSFDGRVRPVCGNPAFDEDGIRFRVGWP